MGKLWRVDILVGESKRVMLIVKLRKTIPVYVSSNGVYVDSKNWGIAKKAAQKLRKPYKPYTSKVTQVTVIARYAAANNISYEDAAKLFGPLSNRKTS